MNFLELKANAKINLSLDVTGKRDDGYHEVKMIMQTISLHDTVLLEQINDGIEVVSDSKWIPDGNENIAYKAADLLMNTCNLKKGVRIKIMKRIPVAAGLAGGSSDAACVLKGMNSMFSLGLNESELMSLGKQIGADVPYCIKGGTMLAEGIGEKLTGLDPLPLLDIVLIKPKIGVSTAWVYKNLDLEKVQYRPDTQLLINAIKNKSMDILAQNMKNVLESVTIGKYEIIQEIKDELVKLGALGSMMSGSGPTVFGIFADRRAAQDAFKLLKNEKWNCFITETINEESK